MVGIGAALITASTAMGDPGPTQPPPPPPPPPSSTATTATITATPPPSSSTASDPKPPKDSTPPPRVADLRVNVHTPGQITLTWRLVDAPDVDHVFVNRGPADRCPNEPASNVIAGSFAGTTIGPVDRRLRQVDTTAQDTKRYCYAVFTLDRVGNWSKPATHLARNPGDTTPPAVVSDVTSAPASNGGITISWTLPKGAAEVAVIRGSGASCPAKPADGQRIGDRTLRSSQIDPSAQAGATYCYSVFAFDAAGNRSTPATEAATVPAATQPTSPPPPPAQAGSSGSSLPDAVGIIGGGAIVLAGLTYVTVRLFRREWEWHSRTGYGIRDLMSIDVRGYAPSALVIPAVIAVCIACAAIVLLLSL
jgi:hypothetical protein